MKDFSEACHRANRLAGAFASSATLSRSIVAQHCNIICAHDAECRVRPSAVLAEFQK